MSEFMEEGAAAPHDYAPSIGDTDSAFTDSPTPEDVMACHDEPGENIDLDPVGQEPQMPDWLQAAIDEAEQHRGYTSTGPSPTLKHTFVIGPESPHPLDVAYIPPLEELPAHPNEVVVHTEEELRLVLRAQYEDKSETDQIPDGDMTVGEHLDKYVAHELAHKNASQAVALVPPTNGGHYVVTLTKAENGDHSYRGAYSGRGMAITRIGQAVTNLAPDVPSVYDVLYTRVSGHQNITEVAAVAAAHDVPMPPNLQKWVDPEATLRAEYRAEQLLDPSALPHGKTNFERELSLSFVHARHATSEGTIPAELGDLTDPSQHLVASEDPNTAVQVPPLEDLTVPPQVVVVRRATDLWDILAWPHPLTQDLKSDTNQVVHEMMRESQRATIASGLGCKDGFYGLVTGASGNQAWITYRYFMPGLQTSPLGAAFINAGVKNPTPQNLEAMRELGFESREQVLRAAKDAGLHIPYFLQDEFDNPEPV